MRLPYPSFTARPDLPCRDVDPELFYPLSDANVLTVRAAKAVCASCLVREDCLAYALENHEHGVWGMTTENERKKIRRTRATAERLSRLVGTP